MAKKRESAMPGSGHGNPLRGETIGYEAHGRIESGVGSDPASGLIYSGFPLSLE